uniref:EF-hand domain-containing protein n=1 Tax=Chlamydomonas leiostraca TaxID=1034604 RepID=A0A7S0RF79_9CHLO|mmetsp:Transcript_2135/g.5411  ORF Transcript_2135/g.5411 Transcript_2135/m.5411 type:complete len:488 (+) Transcript_2135:134-1597(+)
MSTKYQKPYTIPEGFPALLKGFTREVLRAQPENIYEFGAQYFGDLLASGRGIDAPSSRGADGAPSTSAGLESVQTTATTLDIAKLTPAELEPLILQLFLEADTDHSGYLDRAEFARVLQHANLSLSDRQIRQILAEADENEDDVVQYKEFLPVMVDVLQSIKAKETARAMMAEVEAVVRGEVETMLLHGLPQAELEALMLRVFRKADADGSGQLSRKEFKEALKAAELGLTRKDINLILSRIDADRNGLVSYEEFIPVCFQVLVERFKDEIVVSDILGNQDGLAGLLLRHFQAADPEGSGLLSQHAVKRVLRELSYQSLGLTTLQMVTLISQAPTTPEGGVQYIQFVPLAASMIYSMYDVDNMKLRLQAIKEVAAAGGMAELSAMDIDGLRALLEGEFQRVDAQGSGQLSLPQVMEVLSSLGTLAPDSVRLTDTHMRAMFAAIDVDDSGTVDWYELVNFICDAIEHMEREAYITQVSQQGAVGVPAE